LAALSAERGAFYQFGELVPYLSSVLDGRRTAGPRPGPASGSRYNRGKELSVTDQERQKAEELISRLEVSVGAIYPRDAGNASLITTMIQTLNGLRSLLGIVRPH
jgi:hypothetical protein